jgi:hypothetical protein
MDLVVYFLLFNSKRGIRMEALGIKTPLWLYRVLAIFPVTGLAGVDHYAVKSNYTGMAKAFVNLLTFGSWYFYDALQALDGPKIVENGLSVPFYGPAEIGKGALTEEVLGMNGSSKIFLNIIFVGIAGMIFFGARFFDKSADPYGKIAKGLQAISGLAAVGIIGYTVKDMLKKKPAAAAAPEVPGVPSLTDVTKLMAGGGKEEDGSALALGVMLLLAVSGFALSSIRESDGVSGYTGTV